MVGTLGGVLGSASDEDLPIHSLNAAESNRNREILQKLLPGLPVIIYIVVRDGFLIKLEEVDSIVLRRLLNYLARGVDVGAPHFTPVNRSLRAT